MVQLTPKKADELKKLCTKLSKTQNSTIHVVASVIGEIVATFPRVQYGPLHYKELEKDKMAVLKMSKSDYDAQMTLSNGAKCDLIGWIQNIQKQNFSLNKGLSARTLTSDASVRYWGNTKCTH